MIKYRVTKIELNGSMEQFQQRLLLLSMPIWLIMLPGLCFTISPEFTLLALSVAASCLYGLLQLRCNQIIFEKEKLKLPGIFRPICKYSDIESLAVNKQKLCLKTAGSDQIYKFSFLGLSPENAEMLWSLFAQKLKNAKISRAVRTALVTKVDVEEIGVAQIVPVDDRQLTLMMVNDYQLTKILSYMSKYDVIFDIGFFRAWTVFWTGFGLIALGFMIGETIPAVSLALHSLGVIYTGTIWLLGEFFTKIDPSIGFFGFVLTVILSLFYLIKKWMEPDSLVISKAGITPQLHVATGPVAQQGISWSDIGSINLIGRGKRASGGGIIEVNSKTGRLLIIIPLQAFNEEKRAQFLDTLKAWGSGVVIDPALLEILTKASEVTYTELWLSSLEAAPQLNQLTPLQPGDRLSHHQLVIEKQLGSGGQGVTYLAQGQLASSDGSLQLTTVVLKEIILPIYIDSAKKRITERFERDAKLLKSLDHPQIVKLYDYFIEGHRAFLMLEYINGQTLREKVLAAGAIREQEVRSHAGQMLDILSYLHERTPAVVHRDFTPDNLLLNEQGQIKLLDFDVALESAENNKTQATIVGKQNYLPPEQFRGHPCPQSDFYGMGATLYFMLTGTEPEALGCSHPQKVIPSISLVFDQFIATATEPELKQRFATISEMTKYLSRIEGVVEGIK